MESLNSLSFPVLLTASAVLLVIHIMLQAQLAVRELGHEWNAGPRDEGLRPKGIAAGRAERALRNFQETYPVFIGFCLALAVSNPESGLGHAGAYLWFAARILYIPLYLGGIPYIRSLAWVASALGLALMGIALLL